MKMTSVFVLASGLAAGMLSLQATAATTGIKCQLPAGQSCVCIAGDSSKCKDKYKDVSSCTPNQDVSDKKECPKK